MFQGIGSRYRETRSMLQKKIKEGRAEYYGTLSENHACFFCEKRITGIMYVLVESENENGVETISNYFLDSVCYEKSRFYEYIDGLELCTN